MKITWIGHSCFKIEENGFVVITDPYAPGSVPGLAAVEATANLVCCSHLHDDHAYKEGVALEDPGEMVPAVQKLQSWHDAGKTIQNMIYIFDFAGRRVVHLGDIGCDLSEDEVQMLKGAAVLLIPVGGHYTIGPDQAADLVKRIEPRIVVPMHYRDDRHHFGYDVIGPVDPFLDAFGEQVLTAGCSIETDDYSCDNGTKVIRMVPRNALM